MSRDEADALWDKARDVLNAMAEGAIDCPGCGCLIDADSDCAECGFDPRGHDDECEILALARRTGAYWIDAQAGGCACQCDARLEAAIQSLKAARAALTDVEYQALMRDNVARYGTPYGRGSL